MSQRGSEGWGAVHWAHGVAWRARGRGHCMCRKPSSLHWAQGSCGLPWVVPRRFGEVRLGLVTEFGGGPRSWCEQGA